jgi:hypothetical protein
MASGRIPSIEGGIQPTIVDAKGDLIVATAADTVSRLAVGTNNHVLTADSSTSTGLKWAAPAAGGEANWSLLNSGGTSLSGSTTTVTGISAKDKIMILVQDASIDNTSADTVGFRFNTDTGTNYYVYGWILDNGTTLETYDGAKSVITFGGMGYSNNSTASGFLLMSGCNTGGVKVFNTSGSGQDGSATAERAFTSGGYYNSASTISSISVVASGGNFDGGTVWVYTSA